MESIKTLPASESLQSRNAIRRVLLCCGFISSLLYIGTDILGSIIWEGYNYISQTISELSSIGSPSRPIVVPLFLTYSFLVIGFGFGIRESSFRKRSVRILGVLMIVYGILCLSGPFVPMHQRGEELGLTDTMHILVTIITVIFIFLIVGFGAASFGKAFRIYSIITILVILGFGTLTGLDGPRLAANEPTPWMGLTERVNVYCFMIWVAFLSANLLRIEKVDKPID